jgi:predicted MFS family arabinose efflux permease
VHVCWQDLNSRIVLPSSRGLYVGARLVIVTVGVVSTGLVTYGFLGQAALTGDRGVPPLAFAWPFTVGTVVFLLALPLLLLLREPIPDGKPPAWAGYGPGLRRLLSILRLDRRFARFLSVRALTCTIWLFSVSLMSAMAHEQFGISKADIAMWFTAAFYIAQAAGAPLGGALGDRIGHKLVHCISLGLFSAAYVLAFSLYAWPAGARFGGFLAILALQGVAGGWYFLSQFNLVFEFADDHRRSSYIALTGLVIGWALLGCGVLGGALVAWLGYASTLLVALGAVLVAAVLALLYMPDPRREVHPPTMLPVDRS